MTSLVARWLAKTDRFWNLVLGRRIPLYPLPQHNFTSLRQRPAIQTLFQLEAREQTGSMVNGLFAVALGDPMTEPLQAMAAAVGDLAFVGRTADRASHSAITATGQTSGVVVRHANQVVGVESTDLVPAQFDRNDRVVNSPSGKASDPNFVTTRDSFDWGSAAIGVSFIPSAMPTATANGSARGTASGSSPSIAGIGSASFSAEVVGQVVPEGSQFATGGGQIPWSSLSMGVGAGVPGHSLSSGATLGSPQTLVGATSPTGLPSSPQPGAVSIAGDPHASTTFTPSLVAAGNSLSGAAGNGNGIASPSGAANPTPGAAGLGATSSTDHPDPRAGGTQPPAGNAPGTSKADAATALAKVPLMFEANKGQFDSAVDYVARLGGYTAFLTPSGATYTLQKPSDNKAAADSPPGLDRAPGRPAPEPAETSVVRVQFVGGNPDARPEGQDQLVTKTNYFIGNDPSKWRAGVSNFGRVSYAGVYPGIDLSYYGTTGRQLEYDWVVAPGADPGQIRMQVTGATGLRVDGQGNLVVSTPAGDFVQHAPVTYQDGPSGRASVASAYEVEGSEVSVRVGQYDFSRPLVIDPTLGYSTYLGGAGWDEALGVAVDTSGSMYVVGSTASTDFPISSPLQPTNGGGGGDAFVAKLASDGQSLAYSTYLGGTGGDYAAGVAIDATGAAYITGLTRSGDFPTVNPLQPNGSYSPFVAKLNPDGNALTYSTYLGGGWGTGIAVDTSGSTYVVGYTSDPNFPLVNPIQSTYRTGYYYGFVSELNPDGSDLVYSTYLGGGGGHNYATGVAVDASGSAYVVGYTDDIYFPTVNPLQPIYGGGYYDAFVTKFAPGGQSLAYSTYLGGAGYDGSVNVAPGDDEATGVAVDASGSVYVVGYTSSTNFPTFSPLQPAGRGRYDAFVAKLAPDDQSLAYSTYLGGTGTDEAFGVAVDTTGSAYVVGNTGSTDFPTVSAFQSTKGAGSDAFVAKLAPDGRSLAYSTYLGGAEAFGVAVDATGSAYIVGSASPFFPTVDPLQPTYGGNNSDAFVAKIGPSLAPPGPLAPLGLARGEQVRPVDGALGVEATDLTSDGFGVPWGQRRVWSNEPEYASGSYNGNGWVDLDLPRLVSNGLAVKLIVGTDYEVFDPDGSGGYTPRFFVLDALSHDTTNHVFTLARSDGSVLTFDDFDTSWPAARRGQFDHLTDPAGNITQVTARQADGTIGEVQRTATVNGVTVTESYLYDWTADGKW